jgi:nucleotide-binding universal stress UspA family protein
MFKHILVPTDGSKLAAKGIKLGVRLAKALGAKVTGVYVILPYVPPVYGEMGVVLPGTALAEYSKFSQKAADKALAAVKREAKAAGISCALQAVYDAPAWRGVLATARKRKCDAIAMATHGRGGLGGLLLGSVASRVLAHSKIPVVVTR